MYTKLCLLAVLCGTAAGCLSVPAPDLTAVSGDLGQHFDLSLSLVAPDDEDSRTYFSQSLLDEPLTPNSVIQVALLGDRAYAELATLGVSQAQRVEAAQLANPRLGLGALRPEGGGRWQLDVGISQNLLDLLTRSRRQALAQAEFERLQLEVLERLTDFLQQVHQAYYLAVAATQAAALMETMAELADVERDWSQRLFEAGNASEPDSLRVIARAVEQRVRASQARAEANRQKWRLAELLGLTDIAHLRLPDALPEAPQESLDGQQLIRQAQKHRLDLMLARHVVQRYEHQLSLYRKSGRLDHLEVGLSLERGTDGRYRHGPDLSISLPVFHQGQARLAAFEADMARARHRLRALELGIQADILRTLADLDALQEQLTLLRDNLLPLRTRLVTRQLERYNFMLEGVDAALQSRQQEYDVQRQYLDTLSRYWQVRTALAQAVGGRLKAPATSPVRFAAPAPSTQGNHLSHRQAPSTSHPAPHHHEHHSGDHR